MKKSLLALAAMGAFAGAAQAQSSVTVYGILDMGYAGGNTRQATGSAVTKSTAAGVFSSSQSTSRLGFRGTEDLGGGTSAFFTVEIKLTPDATSAIESGATQNRQTFVGLAQKGIGRVALGTQYTPIHEAVAATDPGGQNNVVGDLIYTVNGSASGATQAANSGLGGGNSYSVRASNSLTLKSENIAGFTARAILVQKNSDTTQTAANTGGNTNASGWGLGIDYQWKKLYLTANYQAFTARNTSSTSTNPTITLFSPAQANTLGTNVDDNQQYYAATYDFGIVKAFAQYINRKATANNNSAYYQKYTAQQIGVQSYLTKTVQVWASGGTGGWTAYGTGYPKANLAGYQLGSNYWLSKRTNLYAIYGQTSTSNAVNTSNANSTSYNTNNYAVGVRHTF